MRAKTARRFLNRNEAKIIKHKLKIKILSPSMEARVKKCLETFVK